MWLDKPLTVGHRLSGHNRQPAGLSVPMTNRKARLHGRFTVPLRRKRMPDDKSKTRPQDASKINVHEKYEVEYWTKHLGVTPEKLKDAVNKVGVSVKEVKKHLGK